MAWRWMQGVDDPDSLRNHQMPIACGVFSGNVQLSLQVGQGRPSCSLSCGRQVMVARVVTVAVGEAPTMPKVLHLDPCSGPTVGPVLSWPSDCLAPLSSPQQNGQKEDLFLVFTQLSF